MGHEGDGYGRNWLKWVVIYLIVGGGIYFLVWLLFLRNGYGG